MRISLLLMLVASFASYCLAGVNYSTESSHKVLAKQQVSAFTANYQIPFEEKEEEQHKESVPVNLSDLLFHLNWNAPALVLCSTSAYDKLVIQGKTPLYLVKRTLRI